MGDADREQRVAVIRREVTPQMIAAGGAVMIDNEAAVNSGEMHLAELVSHVFAAMRCEQQQSDAT